MDIIIDGLRVHASTGGREHDLSQPTAILIHGSGMDHTVWQLQTRALAHAGYNVIALDLPGHGASDGPAPTTIAGFSEGVTSVIATLDAGPAHVVGHSMGALIGIDLAARFPETVKTLALIGVAESMPVHPKLLDAAQADDHLAFELVASWSHDRSAHTGGHPSPGLWMMGSTLRLLERAEPGVLFTDLAACNTYDAAPDNAASIDVPVLVLMGARDLMTRPQSAASLANRFPSATMLTVPDAGHMVMIERPDTVLHELLTFWREDRQTN